MKFIILLCLVWMTVVTAFRLNNNHGRIVGGYHAEKGEIPYQVSLQKASESSHFCGGVIYNKRYIITAAHCVSGESYSSIIVRAGSIAHNSGGELYSIEKIVPHPNYDSWTMDYDVALLKTSSEMKLSPITDMNNIPLVSSNFYLENKRLVISGWGFTRENGHTMPTDLQMNELQVVSSGSCNSTYSGQISDRMICAGQSTSGGICNGDSGGPATVIDGGFRKLAGISSWNYRCGMAPYPSIFTSIPKLGDWIKQNAV